MKPNHLLKTGLYVLILCLFFSCRKADASYIPDLGARWKDASATVNDTYFFNPLYPSAKVSTFTGNEDLNFSDQYTFSGDYENSKIQFTFTSGPKTGIKYSGTVSGTGNNSIITLHTPTGTIVLTR